MPTKKGAGGRQQNYDPHTGRFAKTDYAKLYPPREPRCKEKARKREEERREALFNRARNSKDEFLFETYYTIEQAFPGTVVSINEKAIDPFTGFERELDIVTKKCIIEVKGKKVRHCLIQFQAQKRLAELKNKVHIVFAPNILSRTQYDYEKNGIKFANNFETLIKMMKEHEK